MHSVNTLTEEQRADADFRSCLAAYRCGDSNPLRNFLGLDLKGECEDCGEEHRQFGHGKSLVCLRCWIEREKFLAEVIK